MFRYISQNKGLLILLALVLASFLWMTSQVRDPGGPSLLERGVNAAAYPFVKSIDAVTGALKGVWDSYFNLVGLVSENERMREENGRLVSRNTELKERLAHYARLEELWQLKKETDIPSMPAQVIGRDPTSWFKSALIDAGTSDGIAKNMPTAVYSGLVGRVIKPYHGSSRLMLITDPGSSVSCLIERSRATGILAGNGTAVCTLDYVDKKADVAEGDLVITSGLDRVYPKGMPVGVVSRVKRDAPGYFQEITVSPTADLDHVEDVLIIMYTPEPGE